MRSIEATVDWASTGDDQPFRPSRQPWARRCVAMLAVLSCTAPAPGDEWCGTLGTSGWYDCIPIPCEPSCGVLWLTNWSCFPGEYCDYPLPVENALIPEGFDVVLSSEAALVYGFDCDGHFFLEENLEAVTDARFGGTLEWRDGHLTVSTGTVSFEGYTLLHSGETKWLECDSAENTGTIDWVESGNLEFQNVEFTNLGLFEARNDQFIYGTSAVFNNAGTLRKIDSPGVSYLAQELIFNNTGRLEVLSGKMEIQSGGSSSGVFQIEEGAFVDVTSAPFSFNSGATVAGEGVLRIVSTSANVNAAAPIDNIELYNGTLAGTGTATVHSGLWLAGTAGNTLDRLTVVNRGDAVVSAAADVFLRNGADFENRGRFDFQTDQGLTVASSASTFVNDGEVRKSGGLGASTIGRSITFTHNGQVIVDTGTLALKGTGSSTGLFDLAEDAVFLLDGTTFTWSAGTLVIGEGFFKLREASTLTINAAVAAENVHMSCAAAAGAIGGSGSLTTTGQFILDGAAAKTLRAGAFVNDGTVRWADSGALSFSSPAPFLNRNRFEITGDATFQGSGTRTFENEGIVSKTAGTGASVFSLTTFNNAGTVEAQSGSIQIRASGASARRFVAAEGASVAFMSGGYTLNAGATFEGPGYGRFAGATMTVPGAVTADNLELSAGSLRIDGSISCAGNFRWLASTINGAGTLSIADTGSFDIDGTANRGLNLNRTVNRGLAQWNGTATISMASDAVLENRGTFEALSDATLAWISGTETSFANSGTFRKSAGTGTSVIRVPFYNTGATEVLSGVLDLRDGLSTGRFFVGDGAFLDFGAYRLSDGTVVAGPGFARTTTFTLSTQGNVAVDRLLMRAGSLDNDGNLTVNRDLVWQAGTFNGSGTALIGEDSTFTIEGTATKGWNVRHVRNQGTTIWTGTGAITMSSDAVLDNTGTVAIENDSSISWISGTQTAINNSGTLRKQHGTATTTIHVPVNNSGRVEVQDGVLLLQDGTSSGQFVVSENAELALGSYTLGDGTLVAGPGFARTAGSTMSVAGNATVDRLLMGSGSVDSDGDLTIIDELVWQAGNLNGSGSVRLGPDSEFTLEGTTTKPWNVQHVLNEGLLKWTGTGNISMTSNAVLDNTGTMSIENDSSIAWISGPDTAINNSGTVRKVNSAQTSTIHVPLNNSGVVEAEEGVLELRDGVSSGRFVVSEDANLDFGNYMLGDGTVISGPGSARTTAATLSATGNVAIDRLIVRAGSLDNDGSLTISDHLLWQAGSLNGTGSIVLTTGSRMTIEGTSTKSWKMARVRNAGLATWIGTGVINMANNAVFDNVGVFEVQNDAAIALGNGPQTAIHNFGLFRKTVASQVTTVHVPFDNAGTVDAASGSLVFQDAAQVEGDSLTGGIWRVHDGATLDLGGNVRIRSNRAAISLFGVTSSFPNLVELADNQGALSFLDGHVFTAAGPFENAGILAIGAGGARLDVPGGEPAFRQLPSGTLGLDITGLKAGEFGSVRAAGVAQLAGTLWLRFDSAFRPSEGDRFEVLRADSVVGAFDAVQAEGLPAKWTLHVEYPGNAVVVEITSRRDGGGNSDGRDAGKIVPVPRP